MRIDIQSIFWWAFYISLLRIDALSDSALSKNPSTYSVNSNRNEDWCAPLEETSSATLLSIIRTRVKRYKRVICPASKFLNMRGGSDTPVSKNVELQKNTIVIVTTSFGSSFLDKKKKLFMAANATVSDLKHQIQEKFPGQPPVFLQHLYFTSHYLDNDDELLGNLTTLSPIPIALDMLSGTSVYNRTMSVTQAIDAYVSSIVQQVSIFIK